MKIKHFFRSKSLFVIGMLLLNYAPMASANLIYTTSPTDSNIHYEQLSFMLIKAPITCSVPYPVILHVIKKNDNPYEIVEIDSASQSRYKKISVTQNNELTHCQEKFDYHLTNNLNTTLTLNGMRLTDAKTQIKMTAGTWVDDKGCQGTFYSTPFYINGQLQ